MLRLVATTLVFLGLSLTAQVQERVNAILVLVGSGSMWGQIDGVNKIVIARDMVGDLLATLPGDQALGLMAYWHPAKGDCGDIERLAEPGRVARDDVDDHFARNGSRVRFNLPETSISYVLRYNMEGNVDLILATSLVAVEQVSERGL
ncbi:MAG TPA: hypothetical protein DEO85_10765 [Maritimibacter sp.]|nr:hypothetical protein [Maritimibacter sp.]